MFLNCIFVGLGGFAGSVFRYLLSIIPALQREGMTFGTLIANVAGALIIGIAVGYGEVSGDVNPHTMLLIKTGLCGGFTTFSTFALETWGLISSGRAFAACIYMAASMMLCLTGIYLGMKAAYKIWI